MAHELEGSYFWGLDSNLPKLRRHLKGLTSGEFIQVSLILPITCMNE